MRNTKELQIFAKQLKVLFVEDDKSLNDSTVNLLRNFFPVVKRAYDGVQALALYKQEKFNIVITDISMPNMNGVELSAKIKEINKNQTIIITSAHDESEYLINLINIGIDGFLLKPYNWDTFFAIVLKICQNEIFKKEFEKEKTKKIINAMIGNNHKEEKNCFSSTINRNLNCVSKLDIESIQQTNIQDDNLYLELKHLLNELLDLNSDFENAVNMLYLNDITDEKIEKIINILNKYHLLLLNLESFKNIAYSFQELADILKKVDTSSLTQKQRSGIEILEFIQQDFANFVNLIFLNKKVEDIGYYIHALKIATNDLEVKLGFKQEEYGDVDFF